MSASSTKRPASLVSVSVPKGQAAPTSSVPAAPPPTSAGESSTSSVRGIEGGTKALSLRIDARRYRALQMEKVESGHSHREILIAALDAFLSIPPEKRIYPKDI